MFLIHEKNHRFQNPWLLFGGVLFGESTVMLNTHPEDLGDSGGMVGTKVNHHVKDGSILYLIH